MVGWIAGDYHSGVLSFSAFAAWSPIVNKWSPKNVYHRAYGPYFGGVLQPWEPALNFRNDRKARKFGAHSPAPLLNPFGALMYTCNANCILRRSPKPSNSMGFYSVGGTSASLWRDHFSEKRLSP